MMENTHEEVQALAAQIRSLATPDNLGEFSTALTLVIGQAAAAAGLPNDLLVLMVTMAQERAVAKPEEGTDEFTLLTFKKAASWC
jgi:hypothetical protein